LDETWRTVELNEGSNYASETETQDINFIYIEKFEKLDNMGCHIGDIIIDWPGTMTHASIVEEDDLAMFREAVNQQRIPVVDGTSEVHKEEERYPGGGAENTVG
jgi:hypothetical protein